ncbi:MAG: EamA family transporter RarD [Oligoflexia bacterium]|nr:EamA family transporter RarD [Oligoflexia bacterium]
MNPALFATIAFFWWGLVPAYWKLITRIPAVESIHYRILFSFLFLIIVLKFRSQLRQSFRLLRTKKQTLLIACSGLLIGLNWFLYVWAINHNQIVEASLGYFINPLVNIALGTLFFREKMNRLQVTACILAAIGVSILTWKVGTLPWISLGLAFTFALYGLCRKVLQATTIDATFLETLLLSPISFLYLIYHFNGSALFSNHTQTIELLAILCSGVVTTVPLLCFAEAAKHLALSTLGFFQFIAPTLQFLLGVFVYKESFDFTKLVAFIFIWLGLTLFIFHSISERKKKIQYIR